MEQRLRILVCVEATQSSIDAAETAHRLFGADAEYTVLSVGKGNAAPLPGEAEVPIMVPFNMAAAEARGLAVETAAAVAREALTPASRAVGLVSSRPGDLACDVARRMRADYIVVGHVRRGLLRRIFMKSFGLHVVRNAPCGVVVGAPPPE